MFESATKILEKEEVVEDVEKTEEELQKQLDELRLKQISIMAGLREELSNKTEIEKELLVFQAKPAKSDATFVLGAEEKLKVKKEDAEKLSDVLFVMLEDVNNSLYGTQDKLIEYIDDQTEKTTKGNENETLKHFNSEMLKTLLFEDSNTDIEIAEKQRRMTGLVREMMKEGSVELDEAIDLAEDIIFKGI